MPQLDIIIFSSQTFFIFLFWIGYFVFIKTILPLVSMEMKLKQKRLLSSILWFKSNLSKTLFFNLPFGKLVIKTRGLLNSIDFVISKKQVFFGIYQPDLLFLKQKGKQ
jgi:hypothetical protein